MLKKNKKKKNDNLRQVILVEKEAPPSCPIANKAKSLLDPKKHVGRIFNVPAEKVNEMDIRDLKLSREYADYLNSHAERFMLNTFDRCEYRDASVEGYDDCVAIKEARLMCFWIDGNDFVILYWRAGVYSMMHKVERNDYSLNVDGYIN